MHKTKAQHDGAIWRCLNHLVRSWMDHYWIFNLPIRGRRYYLYLDWWCSHQQGRKPWIKEVHPKCQDINGWRFGWRRISICWGREKIYSPNR